MNIKGTLAGMARYIARFIPPRGLERLDRLLHADAARHFSQEGEDIVLQRIFEGRTEGHYVDVGSHHPRRFSNTCLFYQQGWCGINIEPNPDSIQLFRRERDRDVNLQIGVSDVAGTLTYIVFDEPALNTFDAKLAAERERTTKYRIVNRIDVQVARLQDLLDKHLKPEWHIDFMSIDVEGYDLQVLQSNDWSKYRPTYLLVECLESGLSSISDEPIHRFLSERGYTLYAKTVNTLFYQDETSAS